MLFRISFCLYALTCQTNTRSAKVLSKNTPAGLPKNINKSRYPCKEPDVFDVSLDLLMRRIHGCRVYILWFGHVHLFFKHNLQKNQYKNKHSKDGYVFTRAFHLWSWICCDPLGLLANHLLCVRIGGPIQMYIVPV